MSQQPVSGDTDVIEHEAVDRLANIVVTVVTVVPVALLGLVIWLAWGGTLHWQDLVVLAISYIVTGVGTTVGDVCPEAAPVRAGCYGLRGCWKHISPSSGRRRPDSAKPVLLNRFDWYSRTTGRWRTRATRRSTCRTKCPAGTYPPRSSAAEIAGSRQPETGRAEGGAAVPWKPGATLTSPWKIVVRDERDPSRSAVACEFCSDCLPPEEEEPAMDET